MLSDDRAIENRLEDFEARLGSAEKSIAMLSKSLSSLSKRVEELDVRAGRSVDDNYAVITLLIDMVARQLQITIAQLRELQQYQQQGERYLNDEG